MITEILIKLTFIFLFFFLLKNILNDKYFYKIYLKINTMNRTNII